MNEISKNYLKSFTLYLEVERNFSKHTVTAYNSDILSFLIWLNDRDVTKVSYSDIREYLLYYWGIGSTSPDRPFLPFPHQITYSL